MTPTRLLIGQILTVFAIVVAGIWFATQWAAAELAYQPGLGAPAFRLWHLPVYRPWALFPWWYRYDAYAPHVFDRAGAIAGASGFVACAAAVFGSLWRARQLPLVTTYGSARWATAADARKAGLLGDSGVFLGYRREVAELNRTLNQSDAPETRDVVIPRLRALIDSIVLTPSSVGGVLRSKWQVGWRV